MKTFRRQPEIASTIFYPLTLSAGIGLFYLMNDAGYALIISSYIPLVLAALTITLLEIRFPETIRWTPSKSEIKNDATYMICIQLLLPGLIAPAFILLVTPIQTLIPPVTRLWPQYWSLESQALLMLLIADFFSYWLHRAAHNLPILWRLHAVHHSPEKLYWLNVGRFHPLEKILQLAITSLPFILMDVSEQVLALYLVFYSINGFFQHSNVHLKYGPLNYLISSAELHRWHHSRCPKISGSNFGNNLIIWDLLFGTRFLPKAHRPKKLGLMNRSFPQDFVAQLKAPFNHQNNSSTSRLSWNNTGNRILIFMLMKFIEIIYLNPLLRAADHPVNAQNQVLFTILNTNRATEFGKKHRFSSIVSYQDYNRSVPIQNYESLRPFLEKQMATGSYALTADKPLMYAVTSGTTGQPKFVPILSRSLKQYRLEQSLYALFQYRSCPQGLTGKTLALVSPPVEGYFSDGTPFGSASGLIYQSIPKAFRHKYIIPPEIFTIKDYDLKYRVILCLALAERNLTCLACANPSSLLRLMEIYRECSAGLINSVSTGRFNLPTTIHPDIRQAVNRRLKPDSLRAEELQCLIAAKKTGFRDLWPSIHTVITWTGGSCSIALNTLKQQLPSSTCIRELGYIATELRATLPILPNKHAGLPVLHHHFFEFIKRLDWEAGSHKTILLDQLENHQEYYLIVTTSNGLYRYFMNDIIRVDGYSRNTPLIYFVRKGLGVTSITGEKLYENQVIDSIEKVQRRTGRPIPFFLMLADRHEAQYRLYIEMPGKDISNDKTLAKMMDNLLRAGNLEYQQKRASKRLKVLQVMQLQPGTGEAYKNFYLNQGQREGQFKPRLLQYLDECRFPIEAYSADRQSSSDGLQTNKVNISGRRELQCH